MPHQERPLRPTYRFVHSAWLVMVAVCIAALAPQRVVVAGETESSSFFASTELRATNLAPFRKWRSVLARAAAEDAAAAVADCGAAQAPQCLYREWLGFLDGLRGVDRWRQLVVVNREINTRRYVADSVNWGVDDYWESLGEFLDRFGDCEDFAIAKFLSLKYLGWPDESLRIAAVKDRRLGVGHAVLIAYLGDRTWMLDNQIQEVTDTERVHDYQPVFSINESAWWRHRARGASPYQEQTAAVPVNPAYSD